MIQNLSKNSVWYKDNTMDEEAMMKRFDRIVADLIANPIIKPKMINYNEE